MLNLRILGPLDVVDDSGRSVPLGGPKERRLLAALAVHLGHPVSEERLFDALWGDEPPQTATKTLQSYVSRVRKALSASADLTIDSVESGYVLRAALDALDTAQVDGLVAAARVAIESGRLDEAAEQLREAEAQWRGPVLGDLADEPFALAEAARLEELRLGILEERVEVDLARGRHRELVSELEALTSRFPLRERLWGARILALYRVGRQADALRAYQDLRRFLGEELGIDPSPELRELEGAVLAQSPDLEWADPAGHQAGAAATTVLTPTLPSGVVTFLLTDVEGSTRLWDTSPREMDVALQRHDRLLAEIVAANGGTLLKSRGEGDSTFSVFARTSEAAAAAVAAQAALVAEPWPTPSPLRVRMAIHMGEAAEREGDYYGPAVNRVARLRALAAGGEVLVSRSAAELLADQVGEEFTLVELGERELKDLSRPEHVFSLSGPGMPVPAALAGPVDGPARRRPDLAHALALSGPYVGRAEEQARLDTLWDKAASGERQAVLIGGEPGIGKTALAAALAQRLHDAGEVVVYGRCDEDLGVPYQPFAEAVRALLTTVPDDVLRGLGHHTGHLTRLLPDLRDRLPDLPPPISTDAEAERYTLFEALVALLRVVTADAPLLVVLDDLHWAGKPTMLMLRHVLRASPDLGLLVVCTYRDTEVDRSHPFGEVLADLRRETAVERLSIGGLDRGSVQLFVAEMAGHDLEGAGLELVDAVYRQTGGNPFFVGEVLRSLAELGEITQDESGRWSSELAVADLGLPEGVRDVVGRRLSRLSDAAQAVLSVAAVVGARFELRVLEAVPQAGERSGLLDALEEAAAAGLLVEDRGVFGFAHALVRQTLLDELSSTRRLRLHRSIAVALEQLTPDDVEALAFHFAEAAPDGVAATAADYALAAAQQAREQAAFEAAVAHLERGLEVIEFTNPIDRARRCDLLIERGEVERLVRGRHASREIGLRAADDARAIDAPDRLARAALLALQVGVGLPDAGAGLALLEEAIDRLDENDMTLRPKLLLWLAHHRSEGEGRVEEAAALQEEALHLMRSAPPDIAAASITTLWAWSMLADDEVMTWLSGLPSTRLSAEQRTFITEADAVRRFVKGDVSALDEVITELRSLVDQTHAWTPTYHWLAFTSCRALLDGRWEEATRSLAVLAAHSEGSLDASNVWAASQFILLRDTGRIDDLAPLLGQAVESMPGVPGYRVVSALVRAELGQHAMAARMLTELLEDGGSALRPDQSYGVTLCMVAETAGRLGSREACAFAYDRLAPLLAGRLATVSGALCAGAADRYLGMCAAVLGHLDEAERHFEVALELEERMQSPALLVRTRTWFGRMLLARGGPGDRDRGMGLLSAALTDAESLGMPLVAAEARELLRPPLPAALASDDAAQFVGREHELAELEGAWRASRDGERRGVLLAGEPGVGKSRLATELAQRAHGDGALVLFGRCDEGVGMPYQPFVEALRHHLATAPAERLAAQLQARGAELTRLIPELAARFPDLAEPTRAEPEAERYFLFEAVTDLLVKVASERPVVLVLDDLHWATLPTLLLLRHLLRAEVPVGLLVVATYRDTDLGDDHPLPGVLADLRRAPGVNRVELGGLDRAEVSALVAASAGHELDERSEALAAALAEKTNGNPLFITEVLAHLVETGGLTQGDDGRWSASAELTVDNLGVPAGVIDVVTSRLDRLDADVHEVLVVAAVVGHEIDLTVVEAVMGRDVLDAMESSAEAGLLVERGPGRYGFVHAIVRQTLAGTLSATRLARMHRRIGEAIEGLPRPEARLDELAYHFAGAAADGQAAKAADYALGAGRAAFERAAFEEADAIFLRGLAALDQELPVDGARRVDLLCAIAEMHVVTERFGAYHPMAAVAVEEARALGDPERFARAVGIRCRLLTVADDVERVALCEEALAGIGEEHPGLRAALLADIAIYHVMVGSNLEEATRLAQDALDLARSAGAALAICLETRILTMLGTPDVTARLALIDELVAVRAAGDVYRHRAVACLELGDLPGFDAATEAVAARAEETDDDFNRMFAASNRCLRALMRGELDEAGVELEEVLRLGDLSDPNTMAVYSASYWTLQREKGELPSLVPMLADVLEQNATVHAFRSLVAHSYAAVGMDADARALIDGLSTGEFSGLRRDYAWTVSLALLIEAAARLDEVDWVDQLGTLLRPHSGHLVAIGWGVVCIGAVDRYLGINATMTGQFDDAEARFAAALELEDRAGAPPLAARTRYWFADMLRRRAAPGDVDRAQALIADALADAERVGMPVLVQELEDLRALLSS